MWNELANLDLNPNVNFYTSFISYYNTQGKQDQVIKISINKNKINVY